MAQESVAQETSQLTAQEEKAHQKSMLGPLLCWAVVFADIGTSVYYVPGILYLTVGNLAGFFVSLTLIVFILLTFKYAEVTHRFPQGGGVVTVAAQALNPWFGALGGMFILVDYFLTAAISCLSGILYFSVVVTAITPTLALWITVGMLILLGILNWIGISESARVSLVGAVIAFFSDLAILFTVFTHISPAQFFALIPQMFAHHTLSFGTFLTGFAGSFLAFSGLESISQLSPVMKHPHKKVASIALTLVVLTVGITSPLLTLFSTMLQPTEAADAIKNSQLISLLAGHWGNIILQTEVAISASALLVFASNTAIIGAYHVFMALSRMDFLPGIILKRNKLRGTPHFSIALATGIPIIILIVVNGRIDLLGDMYAFGLLGAFSLTCLGLDIVRTRDWRRATKTQRTTAEHNQEQPASSNGQQNEVVEVHDLMKSNVQTSADKMRSNGTGALVTAPKEEIKGLWFKIDFLLGVLTTILVIIAWCTNLVTKPLATEFGGGVTVLGMIVAYINYVRHQKHGQVPVPVVFTRLRERLPDSILAVLRPDNPHNEAVIRAAINNAAASTPVTFLYLGNMQPRQTAPQMMEIVDPYLDDQQAKKNFGRAESLVQRAKLPNRQYVYLQTRPDIVGQAWQFLHPRDTVVAAGDDEQLKNVNPDRIRYELTPEGKVAHLLKRW